MNSITGMKRMLLGMTLGCLAAAGAVAAADDESTDLAQRLDALRTEYRAVEREVLAARRKAETPEQQARAYLRNPWKGFREQFDEIALEAVGTEVAAGAWAMIFTNELRYGKPEPAWEAFSVLAFDHADSAELDAVVSLVGYYPTEDQVALPGLEYLSEASARASVRAGALYARAQLHEYDEETRAKSLELYREILAKYADVEGPRKTFGEMAGPALYEAEHLQVGMRVPDVESSDETGTAFKLSDYEGKVVLLDFWGFW